MKPINLDRINAIVPYKVETDGKQFSFVTRHGFRKTEPSLLKTEIHY